MNLEFLRTSLNVSTFDGGSFFANSVAGAYLVEKATFRSIISHPSLFDYCSKRNMIQQGLLGQYENPYTPVKTISKHHIEFDSGVFVFHMGY